MSASASLEQSLKGKNGPNTDIYETFPGLVRWFPPSSGGASVWPLHLRGRGPQAGRWSCEFLRDCPRCAHRSVCLFHVCFPFNMKCVPGTA